MKPSGQEPGGARPRAVVIGDLLIDIVIAPATAIRPTTDVTGAVVLRQGGSAATTARWLARLGVATALITCVGRDSLGDALIAFMERRGVRVHASRPARHATGRMAVLLDRRGGRSFVADRGAATALAVSAIRREWLEGVDLVHAPAYSLFGEPLAAATLRAVGRAREGGALVSTDLSSAGFISASDVNYLRQQVASLQPDMLFATAAEARAFMAARPARELTLVAPVAVVKLGARGASVLARAQPGRPIDVPTVPVSVTDTTGAGDAFSAGFLASILGRGTRIDELSAAHLATAVRAGHEAARRELVEPRPKLPLAPTDTG